MSEPVQRGAAAQAWEPVFARAGVLADALEGCKGARAKSTRVGRFLTPNVGRQVAIEVSGRAGRAVLRVEEGRSREKRYFFEVTWDDGRHPTPGGATAPAQPVPPALAAGTAPTPDGRPDPPAGGNAEQWD